MPVSDPADRLQSSVQLIAILIAAAVMQFVPQVSDYLIGTWMVVGLGGAIFLTLMLLTDRAQLWFDPLARLHCILLTAYLVHQFEEHGIDIFGRAYALIGYAQIVIADIGSAPGFTLTPLVIYRSNTLFVWLPFLAALWGNRRFIWPGLAAAGLVLTNAILHIGIAAWRQEYNPGLVTAIVLFVPISLLYFRFVALRCGIGWRGIAGGVLFGTAEHGLLVLRIRYNLGPTMPPVALAVIALAPLIANAIYNRWQRA